MKIVETFLADVSAIRATGAGVPETSFYAPLCNLFNAIGKGLKPKVLAVFQLKNRGAGMPDAGLFTIDQLRGRKIHKADDPWVGQIPGRGVIEVKPPSQDLHETIDSDQIARYWERHGLVLVTNLRSFALIGKAPSGKAAILERFDLAGSETEFWMLATHPYKSGAEFGERFVEYLRRVMLHAAPLAAPRDVAAILAAYAREAGIRIKSADLPALDGLRSALEQALGLKFEGEKGEHFFRSTLVQTLFYGVFSSWVLWARRKERSAARDAGMAGFRAGLYDPPDGYGPDMTHFDWRSAAWSLRVPMIRALFEQVATPTSLGPLGLVEVLDWTTEALNRVDRPAFFASFEEGRAVQYFYEPFLEEFDPALRKDLGVWYTPDEIVRYMVARVDVVLREELKIADGLADPRVIVLDPCCGTGAYLVETLRRIHETLADKGEGALAAQGLKRAAMERVFGFEILPAPFVISHLQLGLLLQNYGAPFSEDRHERAGVYLTNALTGWEPPKDEVKTKFLFPELAEEKDAADRVKREARILVILGNPPYNAFAGVSPDEEQGLVEPYKKGLISEWGIKKFNLDDLYVRFFRLAEKRIAEHGEKRGVVCFISNYSYLSDPSFVVMRERFLQEFDHLWVDCMNGDSRETGKLTPEGKPDPSVFSTEYTHEGIRVGTAIGLMVKRGQKKAGESRTKIIGQLVRFRSFWGVKKRQDLLASLRSNRFNSNYQTAAPDKTNRFSFRPSNVTGKYLRWPKINDLSRVPPFNGPIERRQNSLIRFRNEKSGFIQLAAYLDSQKLDKEIQTLSPAFMKSSGEFKAEKTRTGLKGRVRYNESHIVPYPFKPFDIRLAYLDDSIQPLFSRPSPQLLGQRFADNSFFITRDTADKDPEGPPFLLSKLVCDYDCLSGHARHFPIMLKISEAGLPRHVNSNGQHVLAGGELTKIIANLSLAAREYMTKFGFSNPDSDPETASLIWMHALAIGYSPAYLKQNADGIRQDWPQIPLPAKKTALLASATLGREIAALLDTETPVSGVTAGKIRPELKDVGAIARVDGRQLNPDAGDFDITVGWGHEGKGGITMPGKGKLLDNGDSYDVFLNGVACWRYVPKPVWEYTIGGYQVIKKWLSYREKTLLGRGLTIEEIREVTHMIRRLAAIVALQPRLDKNYATVRDDPYDFPPGKAIKQASS